MKSLQMTPVRPCVGMLRVTDCFRQRCASLPKSLYRIEEVARHLRILSGKGALPLVTAKSKLFVNSFFTVEDVEELRVTYGSFSSEIRFPSEESSDDSSVTLCQDVARHLRIMSSKVRFASEGFRTCSGCAEF